jgi:hypothetical protein
VRSATDGVAVLLAGVAAIADGTIAMFGPDWLKMQYPPPIDAEVLELAGYASKKLIDLASQDPNAFAIASNLNKSGQITADVSLSPQDAVKNLPEIDFSS